MTLEYKSFDLELPQLGKYIVRSNNYTLSLGFYYVFNKEKEFYYAGSLPVEGSKILDDSLLNKTFYWSYLPKFNAVSIKPEIARVVVLKLVNKNVCGKRFLFASATISEGFDFVEEDKDYKVLGWIYLEDLIKEDK